ncbi:hypothetical protein F4604DRAFT_1879014 [Suillus subluteus]|nr:hypothetical protein F4604DRAFT_1879014 [Suillus subluteus]
MDVPDIEIVIQWWATCHLATLWQRLGCAARNKHLMGMRLLFAEKEHFDDEREARAIRKVQRENTRKRKAMDLLEARNNKRRIVVPSEVPTNVPPTASSSQVANEEDSDIELDNTVTPSVNSLQELKYVMQNTHHRKRRELDLGMDYLINADKRTGLLCRRKVFDVCFDNEAADFDHHNCDPEHIMGCLRCLISQAVVCCDIHHPDHFATYSSPTDEPSTISRHSRITKYKQEAPDLALQDALDDWREEKTISIYGWAHLSDLGPSLILPNSTLDRIVDCAHHRKIRSTLDLKKETGWTDADRFGSEIIMLIQRHAPPDASPFAMTPLSRSSSTANTNVPPLLQTPSAPSPCTAAPAFNAPKRKNKCGACNQEGHNARNRVCPRHPSHTGTNKENIFIGSLHPA